MGRRPSVSSFAIKPGQTAVRRPLIKLMTNNTKKMTKQTLAIIAATPAMAKNPNIPAINAMTRKRTALLSILTASAAGLSTLPAKLLGFF